MNKTIYCLAEQALQFDLETDLRGGGELVYENTIELLKAMGYNVTCFQFSHEKRVAKFRGHKIYGLGNISKPRAMNGDYEKGIKEFISEAEKNNADGIYYLSMNLAMASTKIPSVVVSHGVFWNDYQKNDYVKPVDYLDMMKKAIRNSSRMISCDTDTCHQVSVWCPQFVNKLEYIPNYVDLNLFKPVQRKNDGIFRLIFPRRLDVARAFITMEEASDILLDKFNNIEITFCGKGNDGETRQFNDWKSMKDNRIIHIIKEHDLMPLAYENKDLGMVPTLKCEGTSLSLLELYASGIVPVTTWVGGLSDISINNFISFVVNPNDPVAIANIVEYAMQNPQKLEEMRENGQRFIKYFGKDRWEQSVKKVFIDTYGDPNE